MGVESVGYIESDADKAARLQIQLDAANHRNRLLEQEEKPRFYRFPAMAELGEWDNAEQIEKIGEEVEEARSAYFATDNEVAYGVELMDVIHSAETALRMNFTDDEVGNLHSLAISKNRKRGYYDD